ncbi:hypothetical protein [Paenibacillus sp. JZ16]|uniref:hypothetical protein n=1 Tax=Paenibacillus sp. JZ16 TaxID=1906272 RepID=UPI00188BF09E|nr:hypothetical protein [Paenibacillus sp. JZ16]
MDKKMKAVNPEGKLMIDVILSSEIIVDSYGKLTYAIKEAISAGEIEKLKQLHSKYLYFFENSFKRLNKSEKEFIRRWVDDKKGAVHERINESANR